MKTVLIVDDNHHYRTLLSQVLKRNPDLVTLEAASGDSCLEVLNTKAVDLVLMDIMMPGMSGFDVVKRIRTQFSALELPIIMVTSRTEPTDIVEALDRGANDYVTKPLNFSVVLSRVATQLKLAELAKENVRMRELSALNAMVATYNHEINNPLAIAVACIEMPSLNEKETIEMLSAAVWRIADIVKKIKAVTEQSEVKFTQDGRSKMVKLG